MGKADQGGTNFGIFALNDQPCGSQATIAACGMGRSGTTMIARILQALDVPIGDGADRQYAEDPALTRAFKTGDMAAVASFARHHDARYEKWGFKLPAARGYLVETEAILRSPRFIITFRDPVAIAMRNSLAVDMDLGEAVRLAAKGMHKIAVTLQSIHSPVLLVSYEKALQYPVQTVSAVAAFCGASLDEAQLADAAQKCIRNADPTYMQGAGGDA